jgi:DNA-binding SARP family transcriptional activator
MLRFSLLGPLEVHVDGAEIELGGVRQRSLLALLLLKANQVVATEVLIDALWGESPPRTVATSLQNGISQLRKALGPAVLETRPRGYVLHVAAGELDLVEFEQLVGAARMQPAEQAAETLREALALWRGEPLADLAYVELAQEETRRLDDRRLVALEERLAADIAVGRHADVVSEAAALVATHPLHERFRAQLMLALYRCGRQAEALQTYFAARKMLDDELGQKPGKELQELYLSILRQDVAPLVAVSPVLHRADHQGEIVRALLSARLVPVLGFGLGDTSSGAAPDAAAAATHLARVFGCPYEHGGSLQRVAQYVALTRGVGPLYDELQALYGSEPAPAAIHRWLASLPALLRARGAACQLVLSVGYDLALQRALREADERCDVISYIATGRDRGKFLLLAHGQAPRVVDEPNVEVDLVPEERTMILKLHGGPEELVGRVRDSYVVSEDDYIDYLAGSEPAAMLPVGLTARLRRSHFLFVGFDLDAWSMRVFLRRLWGDERIAYHSWAIGPQGDPSAVEHWRQHGVELIDEPLDEFTASLVRRLVADNEDAVA